MTLKVYSKQERKVLLTALADYRDACLSKWSHDDAVLAQMLLKRIK